ncbi:MAG: hypothetical protein L0Z73_20065, partial [Gammaproteobacteria bacterium]|nr:hypothetical protein [Gammaproteobacteria bacterium]
MESAWVTDVLIIFIFLIAVVLAVFVSRINQLLAFRIQRPKFQLKKASDIPPYLKTLYADAVKQLTPLGFKIQHCQLSQDIVARAAGQKWSLVLAHPETRVFAEISPASTSLDMPGYEVNFWSIAPDGNALLTMNGREHTVMSEIPGVTVHDPMVQSIHQQYDIHREERRIWSSTTNYQLLDPAAYVTSQQKLMDGYFANLEQEHGLKKKGDNFYRLSLLKCLKMVFPYFKGELRAKKLLNARFKSKLKNKLQGTASQALSSSEYPVESDILAYKCLSATHQRRLPGLFAGFMLIAATWLIAYHLLGLTFSSHSIVILSGAILLHELGHILAMMVLRYRDSQIMCVRFFGWADSSKGNGAAKWKQVIVYLMGPLPGILAGIALIVVNKNNQYPLIYEAAVVLLLVNYLHLLPFMSLDGGRIMRLIMMESVPMSKLMFPLASGALFAAGGYFLGEPVFWVLAMIIVASIPFGMREGAVLRALHKLMKEQRKKDQKARDFHSLDINNKLAGVFLALKNPRFRKLNFLMKYDLVKSLEGVISQPKNSSAMTSLGLLGLYMLALLLTPQLAIMTAQQNDQTPQIKAKYLGKMVKNDRDSEIASAKLPQQRFNMLIQAADQAIGNNEFVKANEYLKRAESVYASLNDDESLARLSRSYAEYHLANNELGKAKEYQQTAIALYEKKPQQYYYQLAASYEKLSQIQFKQQYNHDSEASLQKGLSFAIQTKKPEEWHMITRLSGQLLDWYYLEHRQADAQQLLTSLTNRYEGQDEPVKNYVTRFVYEELGWLHAAANDEKAAMEKFDKALELAQRYAAEINNKQPDRREETKLLLAKAAVYYKEGYNDFSKMQFNHAEELAKENAFQSIEQYIDKYNLESLPREIKKDYRREARRWKLITDAYRET